MSSTATSHSMVSNGSLNIDDVDFDENLTFQQLINEDICVTDRTTKSLRQFIEKECYCHSEWNQKLANYSIIEELEK